MKNTRTLRTRLAALSLVIAGACFLAYPAIRPYSDEASIAGAEAFASTAWLLSHTLAMVGFILLTLGLLGLYGHLHRTRAEPWGIAALVLTWAGVGLILPYYGAEAFALHAVGREAIRVNSVDLLVTLTNAIRYGEGVWLFGLGLLALAAGTILFAAAIRRSGTLPGGAASPLAPASRSSPQFCQPAGQVALGLLVAIGCWLVAWSMASHRAGEEEDRPGSR
jgi:hypothetical protein